MPNPDRNPGLMLTFTAASVVSVADQRVGR
jgi:hypothetical protein